jgi:hypothetical protein
VEDEIAARSREFLGNLDPDFGFLNCQTDFKVESNFLSRTISLKIEILKQFSCFAID